MSSEELKEKLITLYNIINKIDNKFYWADIEDMMTIEQRTVYKEVGKKYINN